MAFFPKRLDEAHVLPWLDVIIRIIPAVNISLNSVSFIANDKPAFLLENNGHRLDI
jgi:hypothetical protein